MLNRIGELNNQVIDVKEDLAGILLKIDLITSAIDDKYVFSNRTGFPEVNKDHHDVCGLLGLIQDARDLQRELALLQARLANHLDKLELETINNHEEVNGRTSLEIITNGVRITISDEFPPKTSVYDRVTVKNGMLTNHAYAEARNRWYGLIKQAVAGYEGERIVPAIVYVKYYVQKLCDTGNFISKAILDGMMFHGPIAIDDNLENVNAVIQEAVIDKQNPRTEIYVLKNIGQLDAVFLSD